MNNFFEQFKKEGQGLHLSVAEKAHMRAALTASMSPHETASPYVSYFAVSAVLNFRSAIALVLVFVLVGSSSAYAAQGSLPGDLLYPIKVSINEPIELVLATTPEEKIKTEVRFAERRVAEAQALEAEGRLDATTTAEIELEFDRHASRALAFAKKDVSAEASISHEEVETDAQENRASRTMELRMKEPQGIDVTLQVSVASDTASTSEAVIEEDTDEDDGVRSSLQVQRKLLKELRERVDLRSQGEVRGVDTEQMDAKKKRDKDGWEGKDDTESDTKSEDD